MAFSCILHKIKSCCNSRLGIFLIHGSPVFNNVHFFLKACLHIIWQVIVLKSYKEISLQSYFWCKTQPPVMLSFLTSSGRRSEHTISSKKVSFNDFMIILITNLFIFSMFFKIQYSLNKLESYLTTNQEIDRSFLWGQTLIYRYYE